MMVHTDSSGNILWFGPFLIDDGDVPIHVEDIPLLTQPGVKKLAGGRVQLSPPVGVSTPINSPDIAGLIKALLNSQSLDQSTKTALVAALKGA